MANKNYELVTNVTYEDFNLEMLKDYWSFKNFESQKFTYSLASLLRKYGIKSPEKLERIVRNSGFLKFSELMSCKKCFKEFKAYKRRDINYDKWNTFSDKLICHNCRSLIADRRTKKILNTFREFNTSKTILEIISPIEKLKYLEKIFLYILLTKTKIEKNGVISYQVLEHFNNIDACGSGNSLDCFLKKGYLFKTNQNDDFLERQAELRNLTLMYGKYISAETKQEMNNYSRLNFKSEMKVVIPDEFDGIESWIAGLYQEIIKAKPLVDDCKEIENFIINKRLAEVYLLLDSICEMKKIPIVKNNALEIDLIRMLKKYNLNEIYNLLSYQAKISASYLYDIEHSKSGYNKNMVFGREISKGIDYLQSKNESPKYSKPLPENWIYSEIEIFIIANIIKNYEKWHKFTPDQILAMWIGVTGMEME